MVFDTRFDSAAELARRSVTYQKKPKTSADTGDGPCDEEEEDGPEDSEDGIAGGHGLLVCWFVTLID